MNTSLSPSLGPSHSLANDLPFLRGLVIVNGAIPFAILVWDAWQGQLGANASSKALHLTGFLSLTFLMLSLCITPLRWWTGWAGWIAFRRALGLYGFAYAICHVCIYVVFDRALDLGSAFREIGLRRFLQVGGVATLLMIPLAVTSTNTMIQRLGAKRWKNLHRLTYAVAILGVVHYYLLVKSDVRWPLGFAVLLGGLLGARAIHAFSAKGKPALPKLSSSNANLSTDRRLPKSTRWSGTLQVTSIAAETHDVKTFRLQTIDMQPLPFVYLPGQFLNIQLEIEGKRVTRCYTIASSPSWKEGCEITVKRNPNGRVSRYLHDSVHIGDELKVTAPAGKFTFNGSESTGIVLIAGGVGITPLMSVLRYLGDALWDGDVYFFVVARTQQDIIFRDELVRLAQRMPRMRLFITLTQEPADSGWSGERGYLRIETLARVVDDLKEIPIHICGPNPMMEETRQMLINYGVPAAHVKTEAFGNTPAQTTLEDSSQVATPGVHVDSIHSANFVRSVKAISIESHSTILEASEACGANLPYECRSGICGQCKVKLLRGNVTMDSTDALTNSERSQGWILACQSHASSDVDIDA